jgi:hypothetical protein
VTELVFLVEEAQEGGYTARGVGEAVFTEADTMEELRQVSTNRFRQSAKVIPLFLRGRHHVCRVPPDSSAAFGRRLCLESDRRWLDSPPDKRSTPT